MVQGVYRLNLMLPEASGAELASLRDFSCSTAFSLQFACIMHGRCEV